MDTADYIVSVRKFITKKVLKEKFMGILKEKHAAGNKTDAEKTANYIGKYLTFMLQDEVYGIEILKVREIIGIPEITPVPQSENYLKGIINLRGKVIPVIDLRIKFSMSEMEYTHETCIIVVEVNNVHVGIIVDTVSEVLDIKSDEFERSANIGNTIDTDFIFGLGKVKNKIIILLDINKVLNADEFAVVENISNKVTI